MAVIVGVQASLGLQSAAFVAGTNQAAAAMTNLAQRTNASANQMSQSFQKISQSQRVLRGQFQNLAFQVQDVAVQLEMGTAPLRVFTQQAGQIAQIFGPMGAAIGIVVTVLGALAGAFLGAKAAAAETADELKDFDDALSKQLKTVDDVVEQFRTLSEGQRAFRSEAAKAQVTALTAALEEQKKGLLSILSVYTRMSSGESLQLFGEEFSEKSLIPAVAAFATLATAFQDVANAEEQVEFTRIAKQLENQEILAGDAATAVQALVNELGPRASPAALQAAAAFAETAKSLQDMSSALAVARAEAELGSGGNLEGARTTKEFNDSIKDSLELFKDVRKDRADAAKEAATEASKRSEGIAKLQEEAAGTKLLSAAYSENAAAVRDAEIAIAAQIKIRSLDIAAGSKQERQIVELTKSIRENEDAIKLRKTIIASGEEAKQLALIIKARGRETEELRVQQALLKVRAEQGDKAAKAAEKQIRATESARSTAALSEEQSAIEDIIDQQRLLLRYGSDESEEYRVQLRLLQLKQSGVKDITPEMEKQIRLLEQQATGISAQEDAAQKIQSLYENALEGIQDSFTTMFEELYSGGITSFEELALSIKDIFIRLAAELTTLMIIRPAVLGLAGAGGAGGAGGLASLFGFGASGAGAGTTPTGAPIGTVPPAMYWGAGAAGAGGAMVLPAMAPGGMPAGMMTGMGMPFGGPGIPINQTPWWQPGALGAQGLFMSGALGAVGGNLIGGQFGGYGGIGGSVGGGIGAIAGGLTPLGPFGSILGGLGGSLIGGALGGLFGGGGGEGNEVSFGGAALGVAGRGGTGKAAEVIRNIDKALQDLLSSRQEALVNDMLRVAPSVSIKYGEEGPSAGDLASLARARIAPAASALGLSAKGITGGLQGAPTFTAEEMAANFEQALGILQQIENIQLGPLGAELQALKDTFNETARAAKKFGLGSAAEQAALRKQYEADKAAAIRRNREQELEVAAQVGAITPFQAAMGQLKLQFAEAEARAKELGISTANLGKTYAAAQEALREQRREQFRSIETEARALAGLPQTFASAVAAMKARFAELRSAMEELGGSVAGLIALEKQAAKALQEQRHQQALSIQAQAKGLVGAPTSFKGEQEALRASFAELRKQMAALGYTTSGLVAIEKQAVAALQERRHQSALAIESEAKGLAAGGGIQTFVEQKAALDARFMELRKQFAALGYSISGLIALQKKAVTALYEQRKAQLDALAVEAQAATGLSPTFLQEIDALNRRFAELQKQIRALGGDTSKLAQLQKEAQENLKREQQLRKDQMALSIVEPFKQLREPLVAFSRQLSLGNMNPLGQMDAAAAEFRRVSQLAMGGDTDAIRQLESVGQDFIRMSEQFGGSASGADARTEVQRVIKDVLGAIDAAQKLAMMGVEGAVKAAELAIVDTLGELVKIGQQTVAEIKRLSGSASSTVPKPTSLPKPLPKPTAPPQPQPLPRPTSLARQATEDFQRIVAEVQAGNRANVEELQASAQRAILEAVGKPSNAAASAALRPEAVMASAIRKFEKGQKDAADQLSKDVNRSSRHELEAMKEISNGIRVVADEVKRLGRK